MVEKLPGGGGGGRFECVGGRDKEVEAETRDARLDDTWYFCTFLFCLGFHDDL